MHIFISYAKRDTFDLALHLRDQLRQLEGVTVWMDETLEPGESWALQIQQEIDAADYVVVLLSPDVNRPLQDKQRRSFVLNEIDYAQQENKPIIPVMAQKTRVPVQIAGVQFIDFTADPAKGLSRLIRKLTPQADPAPAAAVHESQAAPPDTAKPLPLPHFRLAGRMSRRTRRIVLVGIGLLLVAVVGLALVNPFNNASFSSTENQTALAGIGTTMFDLVTVGAALQTATSAAETAVKQAEVMTGEAHMAATNVAATQLKQAEIATSEAIMAATNVVATQAQQDALATSQAALAATGAVKTRTAAGVPTPIPPSAVSLKPVTANADWTPLYQTFDGVEMALVPPGCFLMGRDDGEANEQPAHEQCFDQPFWIDRYEVTNDQYGSVGYFTGDNQPRDSVTWFEARDFCLSRDARLPTEREWEYAARGPDNLIYPWGDNFVVDNVVYKHTANAHTSDVGSRHLGDSWVGLSDLSGNLWEFVSTVFQPYPYKPDLIREGDNGGTDVGRGLRGGSWVSDKENLSSVVRNHYYLNFQALSIGFRCARNYDS